MTGTARYASIHALEEMEQSRRDDLESMAYVLLYFLRGSLPWQGIKVKAKENRYKKILVKKKETSSDELCETFPEEFKYLVDYTRNLGYTENPDYEKLRQNFVVLVKEKMCRNFDFIYDWTTKTDIQQRDDNIDILNGNFDGNKNNIKNSNNKKEGEINNEETIEKESEEDNNKPGINEDKDNKINNPMNNNMNTNNNNVNETNKNENNNANEKKEEQEPDKVESTCCYIY